MEEKVDVTGWCSEKIKSAVVLAKILEEEIKDKKTTYKCGRFIQKMFKNIKNLSDIKDKGFQSAILKILTYKIKQDIKKASFPEPVESHLTNVISTIYKIRLKEIENEQ